MIVNKGAAFAFGDPGIIGPKWHVIAVAGELLSDGNG